ncbi:hypothetical protein L2E82_48930 [Cichorium intybus]|uniref:Uncharacterized protein n=1 Tax=Cichorium intybus TaxID=13427 RepID=A0ACB8Z030_CICIN|nr:hypothetical protein L2E82_48930 [Cichorium intybus]
MVSLSLITLTHNTHGFDQKNQNQEDPTSFAKTLTQSDANNDGGFSVPRYCAETTFPKLDYIADPPVQTILAKDVMGKFGISDIFTEAVKLAANGMSKLHIVLSQHCGIFFFMVYMLNKSPGEHIQRTGIRSSFYNPPSQGSREAIRGISNLPWFDQKNQNQEDPTSFAKTLTQSDANNDGGFSVPRYCAETTFPKLDYTADPPVQTILAKDVMGKFGNSDIFTEAVKLAANGMSKLHIVLSQHCGIFFFMVYRLNKSPGEHIQRSGIRYFFLVNRLKTKKCLWPGVIISEAVWEVVLHDNMTLTSRKVHGRFNDVHSYL